MILELLKVVDIVLEELYVFGTTIWILVNQIEKEWLYDDNIYHKWHENTQGTW